MTSPDQRTADAFATSWNHLPAGSVYSEQQALEWFSPLRPSDFRDRRVLELGCGGGSLMVHVAAWDPAELVGVDLGDSVEAASVNLRGLAAACRVERADLVEFRAEQPFDLVYCIGVLHHLAEPLAGFQSVLANTSSRGRFHCWVYAHEGNSVIRWVVDPIRRIASRLPWWVTKYLLATPLVVPFFVYAKLLRRLAPRAGRWLPLHAYALWIAEREFGFFRHVAFDQLVTPRTAYLRREMVEGWLTDPRVEPLSTYLEHRNGNSWKFGGRLG